MDYTLHSLNLVPGISKVTWEIVSQMAFEYTAKILWVRNRKLINEVMLKEEKGGDAYIILSSIWPSTRSMSTMWKGVPGTGGDWYAHMRPLSFLLLESVFIEIFTAYCWGHLRHLIHIN